MDVLHTTLDPFEHHYFTAPHDAHRFRVQDYAGDTYYLDLQLPSLARKFPIVCQPFSDCHRDDVRTTAPVLPNSTTPTYNGSRSVPTWRWSKYRPIITELYMNRKLDEVRRIMQDEHDFDAT